MAKTLPKEIPTKEVFARLHKELWNWLSENPGKDPTDWPKWTEIEEKYGIQGWQYQFNICCAYAGHNYDDLLLCNLKGDIYFKMPFCCTNCLCDWPGGFCFEPDGEKEEYKKISLLGDLELAWFPETKVYYASLIANLPIRINNSMNEPEGHHQGIYAMKYLIKKRPVQDETAKAVDLPDVDIPY